MKIEFKESFTKSLKKLKEKELKDKLLSLIDVIEKSNSITSIPNKKNHPDINFIIG